MKKNIIKILGTIIYGVFMFYIFLPALNIHNMLFWVYAFSVIFFFFLAEIITEGKKIIIGKKSNKKTIYTLGFFLAVFLVMLVINIFNSPLMNSKSYYNRITINEDTNFLDDVKQVDFDTLPLLDKASSSKLGDRVMGSMKDLVSQFEVSDLYTQINYNNEIIRVTPLEYASDLKWFTNKKDGVKGYVLVNSVTGESKLVKLNKGMKYMPSSCFNENLYRYIRFKYPTLTFGKESFELDNDGNPYWIIPTIKYVSIGLKPEVSGVVILDPITGETKKYDIKDVPTWVDHVYSAELIIEQVNDWGKYKNGFLNSVFTQKNVVATTEGYNYLLMDDDVYLYTGITSVNSDESNLGFILTNLRTKETKFYDVPGAEEYSAMDSAKGAVQQMNYRSTFPLLINLNNKPTYLLSLKDNAGLVKMYAFVDVKDYQKVVVTDASKGIKKAAENYLNGSLIEVDESNIINKNITIKEINNYVVEGNTYFYITDIDNQKYKVSLKLDDNLPFIKIGDKITVGYTKEAKIINIVQVKYN